MKYKMQQSAKGGSREGGDHTSSVIVSVQYIMVTFQASQVTMVKTLAGFPPEKSLFMMFIIMGCKEYENFIFLKMSYGMYHFLRSCRHAVETITQNMSYLQ